MNNNATTVSVQIDPDLCENTQTCEAVCAPGVFVIENDRVVVRWPQECTACFRCVELCPAGAIAIDY